MTTLQSQRPVISDPPRTTWLQTHKSSLYVMVPILLLGSILRIFNMSRSPGYVNEDEGTYAAQAWSVLNQGELAHYTYWYDHPPLGWITMAGWAWLTDGFDRLESAAMVTREVSAVAGIISAALLYVLARNLGMNRGWSAVAMTLFSLTPLTLLFGRMGFLDNLSVAWTLAALVFASSKSKSINMVALCALSFAFAVLTKETMIVVGPFVLWMLLANSEPRNRLFNGVVSSVLVIMTLMFYPLYAIIKGELLEGPDHVSLEYSLKWQLFERAGSGSILDPGSPKRQTIDYWLNTDSWLIPTALCATVIVVAMRQKRLWPVTGALLIQIVILLRPGYLPQPYVISLVPFAALVIAGAGAAVWNWRFRQGSHPESLTILARLVVIALCGTLIWFSQSEWVSQVKIATQSQQGDYGRDATRWIEENVPHDAVVVTDDYPWVDLTQAGFENVVWAYKLNLDPEVAAKYGSGGWQGLDYVMVPSFMEEIIFEIPPAYEAMQHSNIVARFGGENEAGRYTIYEVQKEG